MTQNYCQAIEVEVSSKSRRMQWTGIFSILFALGFVMISIFYSWYFMIAFALAFVFGALNLHFCNKTAKEYVYEFTDTRINFVKKDIVNRQYRVLSLLLKDVVSFSLMQDIYDEGNSTNHMYCSRAYDRGVYQIVFDYEGKRQIALFAPDDYMIALINDALKQNAKLDA